MAAEVAALRVQLQSLTQRLAALKLRQSRELQTVRNDLEASIHEVALESDSAVRAAEDRLRNALRAYESESCSSAELLSQLLALKTQNGDEVRNLQKDIRREREEADFLRLHACEQMQNERNRLRLDIEELRKTNEQAHASVLTEQLREQRAYTSCLQTATAHIELLDAHTSALRSELNAVIARGTQEVTALSETLQSLHKIAKNQEGEVTKLAQLQAATIKNAHTLSHMVLKVGKHVEQLAGQNQLLRSKSAHLGKFVYGKGRHI